MIYLLISLTAMTINIIIIMTAKMRMAIMNGLSSFPALKRF